jgi:hypothetical protein
VVSIYVKLSEDPRATRGGDSCERFAITSAGTSGEAGRVQIREEQRELQGLKEIATSAPR